MTKETKILIVEDDYFFGQLIHFQLSSGGYLDSHIQQVKSIEELKEILEFFNPDVVLLDLNITDSNGIDTFYKAKEICTSSAIIILTGTEDEILANKLVKEGAQDYLLKGDANSKLLSKTIEYSRERVLQQNRIAESEKRFRSIFEVSPLPVLTVDGADLKIEMANQAFCDLYEVKKEDLDKLTLRDFCKNPAKELLQEFKQENFATKLVQYTSSGKLIHVEIIGNRMASADHRYVVLIIDETQEVEFQSKKYELISGAQEGEKKKIARELHDGLAQNLVLLKLWFESLTIDPSQADVANSYSELLGSSIKEIKTISYSLLPPELDKGLISGLRSLAGRVNILKGTECVLDEDGSVGESEFETADRFNLYRIIQEFINNSLKHAKAQHIWIKLSLEAGHWKIIVKDDGVGFEMDKTQGSLGMSNIQNRIQLGNLDGQFWSEPGKGTELILQPQLNR
jgi:two-component system sensor histidine kinase UhpB